MADLSDLIQGAPTTPESVQGSIFGAGQPAPLDPIQRAGNAVLPPAMAAPAGVAAGAPLAALMRLVARMPEPGTANAQAPAPGRSLSDLGMPVPESVVRTHVGQMKPLPNQGVVPTPEVAATAGMSGDAAEAAINAAMGIRPGLSRETVLRGTFPTPRPQQPPGLTRSQAFAQGFQRAAPNPSPATLQMLRENAASGPYQTNFMNQANARIDRLNAANSRYGMPPIGYETPNAPVSPNAVNQRAGGNFPAGMGHMRDARRVARTKAEIDSMKTSARPEGTPTGQDAFDLQRILTPPRYQDRVFTNPASPQAKAHDALTDFYVNGGFPDTPPWIHDLPWRPMQ